MGREGQEGTGPGNHLCRLREKGQEEERRPREGLSQNQGFGLCSGRNGGPRASEHGSGVIRDLDVSRFLKDQQQRRQESLGCS